MMFEILEGEHIILRKAKEDDYKSMLENVWSDYEIYKWMLFQPTFSEEEAVDRCLRSIRFQNSHYAYFVADKESDEAIGFCGIIEDESGVYEETGICIGRKYQGKGYGKEVLNLLLDLSFNKLDAKSFRYGYFHDNIRSKKLSEDFGFEYEYSKEIIRQWDSAIKTVDYCLLSREKYMNQKEG